MKYALLLMLLLTVGLPASAQEAPPTAVDWAPADVAGLLRLNLVDPPAALSALNVAALAAAELQPVRVQLSQAVRLDDLLPLGEWLDADAVVWARDVLPWLAGELAIAYADFDAGWQTESALLILPAADPFAAAQRLAAWIEQQDTAERETYRGALLYAGDRLTLALADAALLIGAPELVRAALDVRAGARAPLTAAPAYQAIQAASPEGALFAYVDGAQLTPAINGLVSGDPDTLPLLAALGAALAERRGAASLEARLLAGGFGAAGVTVGLDREANALDATALLYAADLGAMPAASAALLAYIPRHAALVHIGADAAALAQDVLAGLPLSNFAGQILGGLPVVTAGDASPLVTAPSADDMLAAIRGFEAALAEGGVNLTADLLDRLAGEYALALLPRPNDPLPGLRTPFDLLLAAAVKPGEGQAALEAAQKLLQALFRLETLAADDDEPGATRLGSPPGASVVFELRLVDDTLLITTGEAGRRALAAKAGDNRLTAQRPWQALNQPDAADWYVDVAVFFNMFFPAPGGASLDPSQRLWAGLWARPADRDLHRLTLRVLLPLNP